MTYLSNTLPYFMSYGNGSIKITCKVNWQNKDQNFTFYHQTITQSRLLFQSGNRQSSQLRIAFCIACSRGKMHDNRSAFVFSKISYASVNSSCAHPPPPGQLRGICTHCQSRGLGISLPKGYPRAFDTHVVSDSKSKRRRFYRKRPVVCHWLGCLSRTGPNCGGF